MISGTKLLLALFLLVQSPEKPQVDAPGTKAGSEKSQYFAFVDREYIFTIELVKPGIPVLNFVSMSAKESKLLARNVRLELESRKSAAKLLSVETGDSQRPMSVTSLAMRPRSSFGVRVEGDFGSATEVYGATVRVEDEEFRLAPLSSFDFENLVLKVNRLNLGSPDFRDDWRILRLDFLGTRGPARRAEPN